MAVQGAQRTQSSRSLVEGEPAPNAAGSRTATGTGHSSQDVLEGGSARSAANSSSDIPTWVFFIPVIGWLLALFSALGNGSASGTARDEDPDARPRAQPATARAPTPPAPGSHSVAAHRTTGGIDYGWFERNAVRRSHRGIAYNAVPWSTIEQAINDGVRVSRHYSVADLAAIGVGGRNTDDSRRENGQAFYVTADTLRMLDAAVDRLQQRRPGARFNIASVWRGPWENPRDGDTEPDFSPNHGLGLAVDVTPPAGVSMDQTAAIFRQVGARGIGRYPSSGMVHADLRGNRRREWVG